MSQRASLAKERAASVKENLGLKVGVNPPTIMPLPELQAETDLRKFAAIADRCSEFIGVCDMNYRPIYINEAGMHLVGLHSLAHAQSVDVHDFFFPEDVDFLRTEFFPKVLRTGQAETEIRFRHFQTGQAVWMIYNVFVIRNQSGEPLAVATFSQNISQRRSVEDTLREKDERLRAALTASGTGTFRWNIQTNALEWDENLDRLFGLPPGQTVRSLETFIATVHPEERQGVIDRCQRCAREGADFDMEFRVVWPDGSVHWLDDKGKTFFDADGKPQYMTGACVDITERRRTQDALRESEEKYRSLFHSIDEGFAILEMIYDDHGAPLNYRFLEVNPAFESQTGLTNTVGKTILELAPDVEHWWIERYGNVARTGDPVRFQNYFSHQKAWYDVYASRVGAQGSNRVAVVFNNITQRRQAEDALRRSEQLAAAGRMAAVVAHEINNPLESVVNIWYLLGHEEMSSRAREFLATAGIELDRVMHIAKQTLSFYRAPSRPQVVDIAAVIVGVVSSLDSTARQHGTKISVDHHGHVLVSAHENELRQVILNLLTNAVEAGSNRVNVKISPSVDWKDPARRGVRVTVIDDGMGIPKERLPYVFEAFYTTKNVKGTGLGLWVSKSILAKHGGSLRLRSTTGTKRTGTCFSIFLPELAG